MNRRVLTIAAALGICCGVPLLPASAAQPVAPTYHAPAAVTEAPMVATVVREAPMAHVVVNEADGLPQATNHQAQPVAEKNTPDEPLPTYTEAPMEKPQMGPATPKPSTKPQPHKKQTDKQSTDTDTSQSADDDSVDDATSSNDEATLDEAQAPAAPNGATQAPQQLAQTGPADAVLLSIIGFYLVAVGVSVMLVRDAQLRLRGLGTIR